MSYDSAHVRNDTTDHNQFQWNSYSQLWTADDTKFWYEGVAAASRNIECYHYTIDSRAGHFMRNRRHNREYTNQLRTAAS